MQLYAVNEPMLKLWGRDRSIEGKRLLDFMPELKDQAFPDILKEVYDTGVPYYANDTPVYLQIGEGIREIFMDFTYNPLINASKGIYGIVVTAIDVSERIQSRLKLLESEKNFRNLVLHAPVAMCVLKNADYIIEIANEKMFELWGKSKNEVMHKPLFEGVPEVKEQGFEKILFDVYTTGKYYRAEELPVNLLRQGKIRTAYVNFVYEAFKETDEKITGIIVVAVDVTELVMARKKVEEAEERSRLAIDAVDMGTMDYDMNTNKLVTSPQLNLIMETDGPISPDDLVRRIHPDDLEVRALALQKSLKTGNLFYEVRLVKDDGGIKWVRAMGKVFFDSEDKPERILGTMSDITREKQLQLQKDDFIGVASHELKTPITSLKASLQLLTRTLTNIPPKASALLNQSNANVNRLSKLVDDLLNINRLTTGELALEKTYIKVADLANECCTHVRELGEFKIIYEGDQEHEIFADRFRLDQVLINLVNNAVKYAKDSKIIKIVADILPGAVKISVIDKGPGIPPEKMPHLFDRYFQVEKKDIEIAGVGLGLYISAQIVKRHGGEIGVDSELGKGTTFWFTIPD